MKQTDININYPTEGKTGCFETMDILAFANEMKFGMRNLFIILFILSLLACQHTDNIMSGIATSKTVETDTLTMSDKEKIKVLASQVPDSTRNHFSVLLNKWIFAIDHNPKTRYSASTYSYAKLPEFDSLRSMGKQIIPLIMERLTNPSDFYLLVLYEAIQKDNNQNFTYKSGDSYISESEQNRAIRCVKKWLANN